MRGLLVMNGFSQTKGFALLRQALLDEAAQEGTELHYRTNAQLLFDAAAGIPLFSLEAYDFCLFWDKDVLLGQQLEALGLRLFNSSQAIALADNKARTHLRLAQQGLPQPKTVLAPLTFQGVGYNDLHFLEEAIAYLGLPMVIKECYGSFGWQVYMAKTRDEAAAILRQHAPTPMLLQEYVGAKTGEDLRIYVVGNRVTAAIKRHNPQDFRANVGSGGKAEAYAPTPEEEALAIRATQALGLDFAGVDLLISQTGPLLCEVNSNAHFRALQSCTGANVAAAILGHIRQAIR